MRVGAERPSLTSPPTPVHGVRRKGPSDDSRPDHCGSYERRCSQSRSVGRARRPARARQSAPLEQHRDDKLVVFVPLADLVRVVVAAGAGRIGNYERCAWSATGIGTFRPEPAATPFTGQVGAVSEVAEARVEMVVPRGLRGDVLQALRAAHPYEEPAFDLYSTAGTGGLYWHRPGGRAAVAHDVAWIRRSRGVLTPCHRRRGPTGIGPVSDQSDGRRVRRIRRVTRRGRALPQRMRISPPTFDIIRRWKR